MKLRLALDSPENDIGVLTAINVHGFPERCEVFTDLDPIAGGHDFYLFPAREIRLISAEFTEENPYDAVSYEPVPEGAVTDNFHDTWAAVDELGRRVKEPEDVHERRSSRQVGILYWS